MNYEAERAMNQKRLRMEGEPGHGVVQGNGLPLNYMDNGHQIPYQPYAGAYNTHYPPPDAFAAYGPPPPGGYAPQNLSYAPPAHQNYPHHQSFPPQQPPQTQLHMPQSHMGYGADVGVHKAPAWPHQPHLLPPMDTQKPIDVKQMKPEIKMEPNDAQKRPHPESDMTQGDLEQPKIKIKTDIFKPDDMVHRTETDKSKVPEIPQAPDLAPKASDLQNQDNGQPKDSEIQHTDVPPVATKPEATGGVGDNSSTMGEAKVTESASDSASKSEDDRKPFSSPFSSPEQSQSGSTPGKHTPGTEPKKRGRPKGSTNKPKPIGTTPTKLSPASATSPVFPRGPPAVHRPALVGRPRATGYQYNVRPFRKDFSGIQFRRRWSDDCLESSHIPNEVYFGDVPVSMEILFNYYDANAEREKLAAQAAHIAAQKAAAAKLAAAKLQARGILQPEVTTVDSSSSDDSDDSGSDSDDSEEHVEGRGVPQRNKEKHRCKEQPLKKGPGRPKGSKNSSPRTSTSSAGGTPARRGRPPVPLELRQPGITEMKKFCKAAGIRFDYKKLVDGCTKNKERVQKMLDLLIAAGLEGKPTLEKCKALKQAKVVKKEQEKQAKKEAKVKHKTKEEGDTQGEAPRRMTRGATGVKPRQRIVISSDEEDDTPATRRTLSKLRSSVKDHSDSD